MANWFSQGIFQAALIIVSILIALAFDAWREELEEQELVDRAIYSFNSELRQNIRRMDDVVPFHFAIYDILDRNIAAGEIREVTALNEILQGFQPARLEHTAWDTAVATGALTLMDYELVRGLSLTYNLQSRFIEEHQAGVIALRNRVPAAADDVDFLSAQAVARLQQAASAGTELQAVYQEVVMLLEPLMATIVID